MVVEDVLNLHHQRRYNTGNYVNRAPQESSMSSSGPRNNLPVQQLLGIHSGDESNVPGHPFYNPNVSPIRPTGFELAGLANMGRGIPNQLLMAQQAALQAQRKQREFIPDAKKDESYWDRRRRNNEAAKRSREKRRINDMVLETRVVELYKENHVLRAQLAAIRDKYGITGENLISIEQVLATLPSAEQLINVTRNRARIMPGIPHMSSLSPLPYAPSLSPTPSCVARDSEVHHHRQSVLMSVSGQQLRTPSPQGSVYSDSPVFLSREPENRNPVAELPALDPIPTTVESVVRRDKGRSVESSSPSSHNGSHSGDEGSPSPIDVTTTNCRLLPHKLRHKTHLGDRDTTAATALLILNDIKNEQEGDTDVIDLEEDNPRSTGSSDERDSGISSSEWPVSRRVSDTDEPVAKKLALTNSQLMVGEEDQELRLKLARLVSEVESIKHFLSANPHVQPSKH